MSESKIREYNADSIVFRLDGKRIGGERGVIIDSFSDDDSYGFIDGSDSLSIKLNGETIKINTKDDSIDFDIIEELEKL